MMDNYMVTICSVKVDLLNSEFSAPYATPSRNGRRSNRRADQHAGPDMAAFIDGSHI